MIGREIRRELAKANADLAEKDEAIAVLPELMFFKEIEVDDGVKVTNLLGLFAAARDISEDIGLSYFSPYLGLLRKPSTADYRDYLEDMKLDEAQISKEEFDELRDTGMKAQDIIYHYAIGVLKYKEVVIENVIALEDDIRFILSEISVEVEGDSRFQELLPKNFQIERGKLQEFLRDYDKRLREFLEMVKEEKKPRADMNSIEVELKPMNIITIKSFLVFDVITIKDSLEYFNDANVSYSLPYVTTAPYTKAAQLCKIYPEWNISVPNSLIGYIRTMDSETLKAYSQFEISGNKLTIESRQKDKDMVNPARDLIERIERDINIRIDPAVKLQESSVECFFIDIDFNPWSFKHFLYTDTVMKNFYFIDEFSKVERKKSAITLYYYPELDSVPVVISISNREAESKTRYPFTGGRCHTRVYVKRCTNSQLEGVLGNLARCLQKYRSSRDGIETDLKRIVKEAELNDEYKAKCVKAKSGEELDYNSIITSPNIRSVGKESKPKIFDNIPDGYYLINPEDYPEDYPGDYKRPENADKEKQVLLFPKKEDREKLRQYYYSCKGKNGNIGLKESEMSLDYKIDYLPLCYKDQKFELEEYERAKGGEEIDIKNPTNLISYLLDLKEKEKTGYSYILEKSSILLKYQRGRLLDPINEWLRFAVPSLEGELYRYGLYNFIKPKIDSYVPKEFHNCSILLILYAATKEGKVIEDYDKKVKKLKAKMIKYIEEDFTHCSDTYGHSTDDLKRVLEKGEYIDPRLFYTILKKVFNVDILLFEKDVALNQSPFYPCPPYYTHTPMRMKEKFDNMVMIAINKGGEFDLLETPLCEIIVIGKGKKEEMPQLLYDIKNDAKKLHRAYITAIEDVYGMESKSRYFKTQITGQTLDAFNRVKWLHFDGGISAMLVTPVHSMAVPLIKERNFINVENSVLEFIEKQGEFAVSYEMDTFGRRTSVRLVIKEDVYLFPILRVENSDRYEIYQNYEKISRYLTEYTFLAYSIACREGEIGLLSFFQHNFVVVPDHQYPLVSRYWKERSDGYLRDDKVVVTKERVKVKLMYLLRQKYRANKEILMAYREVDYMPNYYSALSDFSARSGVLVLDRPFTPTVIENGSIGVKISPTPYVLYKRIEEMDHRRWLCYPANSIAHALWVCDYWNKNSSVPLLETEGEVDIPHTELVWSNEDTYAARFSTSMDAIVSVFLQENGEVYQALLPYRLS